MSSQYNLQLDALSMSVLQSAALLQCSCEEEFLSSPVPPGGRTHSSIIPIPEDVHC